MSGYKLKLAFVGDDFFYSDTDIKVSELVCNYWKADLVYEAASNDLMYTINDAANTHVPEALKHNPDIIFVCVGGWELWRQGSAVESQHPWNDLPLDYTDWKTAVKRIIKACIDTKTRVIFMSYPRVYGNWNRELHPTWLDQAGTDGWNWFQRMVYEISRRYEKICSGYKYAYHCDMFTCRTLGFTNIEPWFQNNDYFPTDVGRYYIADRLSQTLTRVAQELWNTKIITYACIGDSWTSIDTAHDVQDHWTRLLGNALGAKCIADAAVGGWTAERLDNNSLLQDGTDVKNGVKEYDQISYILKFKPDMVFMTIGGNDTFNGYNPETRNRMRRVLTRLLNNGVKRILWSYYCEINWDNVPGNLDTREYFITLQNECKALCQETQFRDKVIFIDGGMNLLSMNYKHDRSVFYIPAADCYDDIHPHDKGWHTYLPVVLNGFKSTYEELYNELNHSKVIIGYNRNWCEWMGNTANNSPSINIGDYKITAPFQRKIDNKIKI